MTDPLLWLLVAASLALRWPYLGQWLDRDYGNYFYAPVFHKKLWVEFFDIKPALFHAWAWLVVRLLGHTPERLRLGYALTNVVDVVLVWHLGGPTAACFYVILSSLPFSWPWMASTEVVYALPLLLALATLHVHPLLTGLLIGVAFQTNVKAAYAAPLLLVQLWLRGTGLEGALRFCVGFGLPFVGVLNYLAVTGGWARVWAYLRWTFEVPLLHFPALRKRMGQSRWTLGFLIPWLVSSSPFIVVGAWAAWRDPLNPALWLLVGGTVVLLVSGQIVGHHFQALDPFLALLAGAAVAGAQGSGGILLAFVAFVPLAVVALRGIVGYDEVYRRFLPQFHPLLEDAHTLARVVTHGMSIRSADGHSRFVRWAKPEDVFAVMGTEVEAYLLVGRESLDPYPMRFEYSMVAGDWPAEAGLLPPWPELWNQNPPAIIFDATTGRIVAGWEVYHEIAKLTSLSLVLRQDVAARLYELGEADTGEEG